MIIIKIIILYFIQIRNTDDFPLTGTPLVFLNSFVVVVVVVVGTVCPRHDVVLGSHDIEQRYRRGVLYSIIMITKYLYCPCVKIL